MHAHTHRLVDLTFGIMLLMPEVSVFMYTPGSVVIVYLVSKLSSEVSISPTGGVMVSTCRKSLRTLRG